ncbi:bifunctional riboflavin kinase/FAD synthetase [bacterium]|nr:bifunctional riboflavin kinase/FAD synthetase [bacterium]
MQIVHSIRELREPLSYVVVTMGNFDGIHRGHQTLFQHVTRQAREHDGTAVVLTFDPHPVQLLHPDLVLAQITPLRTKIDLLEQFGIDLLVIQPFTAEFAEISADHFLTTLLKPYLDPKEIIVGENFHFGKDKHGTIEYLRERGQELGFTVKVVQPIRDNETIISSSMVRSIIRKGWVEQAEKYLGRPFMIDGIVIPGDQRGRSLGYPTANIDTDYVLVPADGVYAALVNHKGTLYKAVVNIGHRPTFRSSGHTIEAHLLDFSGDLYNQRLSIYFLDRIREERSFASVEALSRQIERDIQAARNCCYHHQHQDTPFLPYKKEVR